MLYNWRKYEYNPQSYAGVLNKIHNQQEEKMRNSVLADNAVELQKYLQEIKYTARLIGKSPITTAEQELLNQYQELIEETVQIEAGARAAYKTTSGKNIKEGLLAQALFQRANNVKTIEEADNIFEEEFAAFENALYNKLTGHKVKIQMFLGGTRNAEVRGLDQLTPELKQDIADVIEDTANRMGQKAGAKQIQTGKSQKIDNYGFPINTELIFSKNIPFSLQRLGILLKDATFTDKQYNLWTGKGNAAHKIKYTKLSLHLGNTVLYKPIVGVVSEIYSNFDIQRAIFFRGMSILGYPNKKHSATTQEVGLHFSHMRFMYELRGTGLYDNAGNAAEAKYLIYNDPSNGGSIFVRDTASIILENLQKNSGINIFGDITIAASRVNSNK